MYFDAPITSGKEDLFHRSNFSKLLAKALLNLNNDDMDDDTTVEDCDDEE